MELPPFPNKGNYTINVDLSIIKYTKLLKNNKTTCAICLIDENFKNKWHRYKLPCSHIFHTRCYRHFCYFNNSIIKCPMCGVLSSLTLSKFGKSNKYY